MFMISLVDSKSCQLAFGIDRDDATKECKLHLCGSILIRSDGKTQEKTILLGRMLKDMFQMASNVNGIDKDQYQTLKSRFLDFLAQLFIAQHTINVRESRRKRKKNNNSSDDDEGTSDSDEENKTFIQQTVSMIRAIDQVVINVQIKKEDGAAIQVANNYSFKFSAPAA